MAVIPFRKIFYYKIFGSILTRILTGGQKSQPPDISSDFSSHLGVSLLEHDKETKHQSSNGKKKLHQDQKGSANVTITFRNHAYLLFGQDIVNQGQN